MRDALCTIVYLPGAGGGGEGDLAALVGGMDNIQSELISYPGWQRYVAKDFSPETLMSELTNQVLAKVPTGPIIVLGSSIGGHFGYAVALKLQALGREVRGFCIIDSFMTDTSEPSAGWHRRAMAECSELLRAGRFRDLVHFARSKAWRAILRLAGGRLASPLQRLSNAGQFESFFSIDAVAETELNMRLLIREVAPWLSLLNQSIALTTPTSLLRTRFSASDDMAWRVRCPDIVIDEVPGKHHSLFSSEHIGALRAAFIRALERFHLTLTSEEHLEDKDQVVKVSAFAGRQMLR